MKPISLNEVLNIEKVFPNSTIDSARMVRITRNLDGSGKLRALDVGSGYGFYAAALRSNGYKTISINPCHYENKVFQEMNGDPPIPVMFEDFKIKEKYGVILMSQVLEHIVDPNESVYKVSKLLSAGGIFACAVPNFNAFTVKILGTRDNACLWVPEHVNYFTIKGLSLLLERHHLRIIKSEQITRIRYDALERRSSWVPVKRFLHGLVRYGQTPVKILATLLRMGIYINIYARKA